MKTLPFEHHPCPCSSEHRPQPAWTHVHHILPIEHGGPDTAINEVIICPALHDQIHVVLRASKKAGRLVARPLGFNMWGYRLASVGWSMMKEQGVV